MLHFAHIFQNKDHTMNITKPFPLPTGYFGIPLGLAALSLAWFHLENLFPAARMVSDVLGIVASAVWILFILMYAYKLRYYFEEVRAEYHSPVRFFLYCIDSYYNYVGRRYSLSLESFNC